MKSVRRPVSLSSLRRCIEILEQRIAPASLAAIDDQNHLYLFDSANPGSATSFSVSGLSAGEFLIGIDVRPATGGLYGITIDAANAGRVYFINSTTGAATFSSLLTADPTDTVDGNPSYTTLSGTSFGVDFNPAVDRLRVVSDTNQNLRINIDTGLVFTDANINPGGSSLSGAAYNNSFAGAPTAGLVLYDIDTAGDRLVTQNPNPGTLAGVGTGLGIGDITGVGGFDIVSARSANGTATNTAYAALTTGGITKLHTIDLTTGTGDAGSPIAGASVLRGLAVLTGATTNNTAYTINSSNNHLLRFNAVTPAAMAPASTDLGAITGLGSESIIGFDFRPADGALYLVTKDGANSAHLYTVNTGSAVATSLGTLIADPTDSSFPYMALNGTSFGVDFNPVANRLRITSDAGQNLRVNIDLPGVTPLSVITDTDLNGDSASATAVAYTNSFAGATTTTLFDIDTTGTTDRLLEQTNPNGGTLGIVGALGVDATAVNGFDISTSGKAFATLTVGGVANLYSINLTTGAATLVDAVNGLTGSALGLALAPAGSFQFSSPTFTTGEGGGNASLTINRVGGSDGTATVLVKTSTGTAGTSDFTTSSRAVTFGPGVTSQNIAIPITQDIVIEGNESFTVTLSEPTGGAQLGTTKTATVNITDDEPVVPATTLIGLDNANHLLLFNSSAPGTVTNTISVTGLGTETLIGIDFRPATGGLYGLAKDGANAGSIYLINPATGVATLSAKLTADPADNTPGNPAYTTLNGGNFGLDFNPQADRLRVVSDSGQNLRINVDSGLTSTDLDLNPSGSLLSGAAYTNNFAGTGSTTLLDLDVANDRLVTQMPPNDGTLTNGQPLGIDASGVGGFDIVSTRSANGTVTNTGFAALLVNGETGLYAINLATGTATTFGAIGAGTTPLVGLASAAGLSSGGAASATAYAVDATGTLLSFNTATPNNVTSIGPVTVGAGESIIGFDFRPANGQLYTVTKDATNVGRLYTVDAANGAATLLFTLAADGADTVDGNPSYTTLNGTNFGVDFNPFADRLRIVSDAGQSLRVNVGTGLVFTDGNLNGGPASATGAAYTNSFAGAPGTTLYDIDATSDTLYIQNPPNNGTLTAVGAGLNIGDVTAVGGFDIRANGEAYATLTVGGIENLYSINLTSGQATMVGTLGAGATPTLGLSLAPAGTFQLSAPTYTVTENGGFATVTVNRVGGMLGAASVVLTTGDGTASGASDFTPVTQVITFLNNETSKTVQIPITNDTAVEGVETFFATLSSPTGGAGVNNNAKTATVSIADDDVTLYAIDGSNHLLSFASAAPGSASSPTLVTGLGANETLIGIDFRPATGLLYGLTKNMTNEGNLYVINTTTGAATFSAKLAANPGDTMDGNASYTTLSGTNFGVDFNPFADRLRVVSSSGQNLRIDVDTGLVFTDLDLNPSGSALSGAAYTNSFAAAGSTTLYDIDPASDTLVIQNPPNNGTLTTSLPLGVDATGVGGFDIVSTRSADGTVTDFAYATLTVGGSTGLYSINLSTGQATSVGAVGTGTTPLAGLTAVIDFPAAKAFTIGANNALLSFNTATPSLTTTVGAISGLGAGETVIGFDFRSTDGVLYALTRDAGNGGHLYTVNTTTAVASTLGTLIADPNDTTDAYMALAGTQFDVDFNPAVDRLRIVSDSGQNLRVNVDTFQVTTDAPLNGAAMGASGAAYLFNAGVFVPGVSLFEIDPATNSLYRLSDPNSGTLTLVGPLGVDPTSVSGFDSRSVGGAYAALTVGGVSGLYRIDLTSGAATFVGAIGAGAATAGFALAPSGTIQFASPTVSIAEDGGNASLVINRVGGSDGTSTVFLATAPGTAGSGDFTGVSRAVTFGPGVTTQTILIPIINDNLSEGNESFTATLSNGVGAPGLSLPNVTTVTILDNETAPTISIGDVTTTEGTGGTKAFVFTVTLSGAAQDDVTVDFMTIDGTASVADGDYVARPLSPLVIPGGQLSGQISVTVNSDAKLESTENFTVKLSNASTNASLLDDTGLGTIQNDDANSISGRLVTYTDVDGDLVTIKTTTGTLSASNFTFAPAGKGLQLQTLDLSNSMFLNSNVTITAKRTAAGGDGFANIGYLNASGNSLGIVSLIGDLGQIDANAAKNLLITSLGKLGLSTQGMGGSLQSTIVANLPVLVVRTDIVEATLSALNITAALVYGNVVGGPGDHSGSIEVGGRIGSLNILGSLRGGADAESGSIIAKTIGTLKVRDIDGGRIFISGNTVGATATTANIRSALALGSLTATGNVQNAKILVGFDRTGAPVNADVQTGAIKVAGDWVASNLAVGVKAGTDTFYGSDTGALIGGGGDVVARIASIAIKGQAYGSIVNTTDRFGFVSEQIGAFTVGTTKLPLSALAGAPKDNLSIGFTDDVRVREY